MSGLPKGWESTKLGEVTQDCNQRIPDGDELFQYIDIASVDRDTKKITSPQSVVGKDAPSRARKHVSQDDVLVSMTRPNLNAVALVPQSLDGQIASTGFEVLRASGIDPRWIFYIVRSSQFVERMCELVQGALYPAVRGKDIRSYPISLAPLPEQKRIADKLDSTLARVEACRDRLDRIPALLKRFRQSILAAATSGRLTEDWRIAQGMNADAAYPQVKLSSVATSRLGKMLDKAKNTGILTPYLRNVNVRWHAFDLSDIQEMRIEDSEREGLLVQNGDLLVCEGGEPGRCAIWQAGNNRFIFQKALHRVSPDPMKLDSVWLAHSLKFAAENRTLDDLFTGTTIKHLTGVALANFTFALPSLPEQHEIVRRVETLFAYADRLEARLNRARQQAAQLTPALLAKAFRGELVPQDPADEPAAELLQRLAASRAAAPQPKRSRRVGAAPISRGCLGKA